METKYQLLVGDCIEQMRTLPDKSVHCVVTSPPYFGLRDYGVDGQIGLEQTPEEFITMMVDVFREVRRVLADDGTIWVNMGDSYAGSWGSQGRQGEDGVMANRSIKQARSIQNHPKRAQDTGKIKAAGVKPKDLYGIPWMLAFALRADGWYLRQDIIWQKPNPMPESVRDRCTKSHEYIFLLSKSMRYYFDAEAIKEPVTGTAHARAPLDSENPFAHNLDEHHSNPGCRPRRNNGVGWSYADGDERKPRVNGKFPAGWKQGEGSHKAIDHMTKRSGNKERKPGSERGRPEDSTSNVCGSVPWEGTHRNKRSVWNVTTAPYKGAHFATFPADLIEPCILAGTSDRGHCSNCGARMLRQVERETSFESNSAKAGRSAEEISEGGKHAGSVNGGNKNVKAGPVTRSETIGWMPTCECGAPMVPDVVLDPFGGSGTTAGVAIALGRRAILCELNPEYAALVPDRIDSIVYTDHSQRSLEL